MGLTIDILPKNLCTGCSACANICPVNAISMHENAQGFYEPNIDGNICINCGKCEKVCPVLHPYFNNDREPECFAVWADDEIRKDSSSGGMFSVIADFILQKGGYICGATLNDNFIVEHRITNRENEAKKFRRSKYVMSKIGDCYRQIEQLLKKGEYVLFSGCPCQVGGLKNFLGKPYDNLYLADIVCHGAPPQKIYTKYIEDTYGKDNVSDFKFRTKKYGYNCITQIVKFKDGTTEGRDYSFDYYEKTMHSGLALKDACADCLFAPTPRQGDITIGDFWGISKFNEKLNDGLGTSLVLTNNQKGKDLLKATRKKLKLIAEVPFEFARANNRFGRKLTVPQGRKWFYTMIKSQPFEKAAKYALRRKFNIGVVGLWYGRNYGSMVTYYALHYVLTEKLNQSVLMIENCLKPEGNVELTKTSPRLLAQKYYDVSAKYSVNDLYRLNDYCDMYIVGSDQLWNIGLSRPYKQTYFLGFADEKNKKIAYGTSFGKKYEGTAQEKLISSHYLRNFDYVSVRDKLSKSICENEFGVSNVTEVCDPTFLCPVDEYKKLAGRAQIDYNEKYILAYILDPSPKVGTTLKAISKKYGLKIYVILDEPPRLWEENNKKLAVDNIENIDVKREVDLHEWLWYYEHSSAVVTDSFHGTIFSIIFQKPFLTKINTGRGAERFTSLLTPIKLDSRLCENYDNVLANSNLLNDIDYSSSNIELEKIKDLSFSWLKNAVLH